MSGYVNKAGLGVYNHYGPRDVEKNVGVIKTAGRSYEYSISIDPEVISNGGPYPSTIKIPASSVIEDVYVVVEEAFTLGGTTPTINVGTDSSEGTNGLVISKARAEVAGTYDVTSTLRGTWAAPLAADTTVGVALGGTTPTITEVGKLRVIIRATKVD